MPGNPTQANVSLGRRPSRGQLFGLPVIIALDSTDTDENEVKLYGDGDTLAAAHGTATQTAANAKLQFRNRARAVATIKPATIAVASEDVGAVAEGTLANPYVSAAATPTATVDSVVQTITDTEEDPIASTPGANEILLNRRTGDFKRAAAATSTFVWTYSRYNWSALKDALLAASKELGPFEIFTFPNLELTLETYGDYMGIADLAANNYWVFIGQYESGVAVSSIKALRAAADAPHALVFGHKETGAYAAAAVSGALSRVNPFDPITYVPLVGLDPDFYLASEIGAVDTADTFEGEGVPVLHRLSTGIVLSNQRTMVDYDDAGGEIYLDRVRGKINLKRRIEEAGDNLLLRSKKVGFNQEGVGAFKGELVAVCEDLVTENAISRDYSILEPVLADISTADQKARKLGPFVVSAPMVEAAHTLTVDGTLEVA